MNFAFKVKILIMASLIGQGHTNTSLIPVQVKSISGKVVQFSFGKRYCGAITDTENLYMWGRNNVGCLGTGDTLDKHLPTRLKIKFAPKVIL